MVSLIINLYLTKENTSENTRTNTLTYKHVFLSILKTLDFDDFLRTFIFRWTIIDTEYDVNTRLFTFVTHIMYNDCKYYINQITK